MTKLEISIDVIVHATEDISKFFKSFSELFGLEEKMFSLSQVIGHFENPIIILRAKMVKRSAFQFLKKFLNLLSDNQKKQLIQEIEGRTEHSTLHVRLDKQQFIQRKLEFNEKESIRIKIHTPVYNKKDTIKIFSGILEQVN